jgi:hypothetical protein
MKKLLAAAGLLLMLLGGCTSSPSSEPAATPPPAPVATISIASTPSEKPVNIALRARGFHPAEVSTNEQGVRTERWVKDASHGDGYTSVKVDSLDGQPVLAAIEFAPKEGARALVTSDINVSWKAFVCGVGVSVELMDEATITSHVKSAEDYLERQKTTFDKDKNPVLGQRRTDAIALPKYPGCEITTVR